MATLLPLSLQTGEGIGSPGVISCLCKKQFLPSYTSAAEGGNEMKASIGEVNWYCPREQRLMASDIRGFMAPKFSSHCLTVEENPWKKLNQEI